MVVVVQREDTEDVVVFVAGLAVVAAVLLVPPVAVWVSLRSQLRDGVDVAAILTGSVSPVRYLVVAGPYLVGIEQLGLLGFGEGSADLCELWSEACCGGDGPGQRAGRDNAP